MFSVFILGDVASDKRLDVTSVISSTCAFKVVLQKGLTVDLKSQVLACLVSQGRKKQQRFAFLAQFLAVKPQVYLVDE